MSKCNERVQGLNAWATAQIKLQKKRKEKEEAENRALSTYPAPRHVACPCSGFEMYLVLANDEPDNGVPELVQHDNPLLQIPHRSVNQFPPAPDMVAMPRHHLQHVRLCVLRPHDEHLDILLCRLKDPPKIYFVSLQAVWDCGCVAINEKGLSFEFLQ
jgi:hypothetical protein